MLNRKYFAKFKLHLGDGWRAINDDSASAYGYYLYGDTNGFNLIDYSGNFIGQNNGANLVHPASPQHFNYITADSELPSLQKINTDFYETDENGDIIYPWCTYVVTAPIKHGKLNNSILMLSTVAPSSMSLTIGVAYKGLTQLQYDSVKLISDNFNMASILDSGSFTQVPVEVESSSINGSSLVGHYLFPVALDYRTFNNPIDYFLMRIYISSGTNDAASAPDSVKDIYYPLGFGNLNDKSSDPNVTDCMLLTGFYGE